MIEVLASLIVMSALSLVIESHCQLLPDSCRQRKQEGLHVTPGALVAENVYLKDAMVLGAALDAVSEFLEPRYVSFR